MFEYYREARAASFRAPVSQRDLSKFAGIYGRCELTS